MLKFNDLCFSEREGVVRVLVYRYFYKEFSKTRLKKEFGSFYIEDGRFLIEGMENDRCAKKFMRFFAKYKRDLKYSLNKNDAVYVDEDLRLPLMGLNFLGIVDKGTEMIEVKPITNCNLNCSFCSVNEGVSSKKKRDFVVDLEYLIAETNAVLEVKGHKEVGIWINPHGEPLFYDRLFEYCSDMLENKYVKDIHLVTNATLLTKGVVDKFASLGSVHLSVSLSVFSSDKAREVMGQNYNLTAVIKNIEYAAKKMDVMLTPVWIKGLNDSDIKSIVNYAKEKGMDIAIQKFCNHKRGRNPIKERPWKEFFDNLEKLERETGYKLRHDFSDIKKTKAIPSIMKKGDVEEAEIICKGRGNEYLGVIEKGNQRRALVILGCFSPRRKAKVKILRARNNILVGKCLA